VSQGEEMSFLDHLEALRWHLLRSAASVVLFAIIAFFAKDFVFHEVILGPSRVDFWTFRKLCELGEWIGSDVLCINSLDFTLQSRQMSGQFTMHISASILIGLVCAFPYAFWEVWRFISPGLYPKERKLVRGITFYVSLLFASGILFGYYVAAPLSINFLAGYKLDPSIQNQFDITSYIGTLSMIVLSSGLMFQLPIVVYFLSKAGIVTPKLMRNYRRHAILVILIVAAILTPPDVFSQVLISLPLLFLYEMSIFISAYIEKKRTRSHE
jgi:sec-independent protein translocase protein TatC